MCRAAVTRLGGNSRSAARKRSKPARKPSLVEEIEDGKVYGWVLLLRGLEWAAIVLENHPSLRTLCVMAAYMNQKGECRVGQDSVAAKLGITRQAMIGIFGL